MITPPDELYSPADAGALLGVHERTVQRWLKTGDLAGARLGGGWRIPAIALWRRMGIEADMLALWRDYCRDEAAAQREATATAEAPAPAPSASIRDVVAPSAACSVAAERAAMAVFGKSMP